jgi:hypothetical protein
MNIDHAASMGCADKHVGVWIYPSYARVEWEICSEEQGVMLSHHSSAATNGIELIATTRTRVPMVVIQGIAGRS